MSLIAKSDFLKGADIGDKRIPVRIESCKFMPNEYRPSGWQVVINLVGKEACVGLTSSNASTVAELYGDVDTGDGTEEDYAKAGKELTEKWSGKDIILTGKKYITGQAAGQWGIVVESPKKKEEEDVPF